MATDNLYLIAIILILSYGATLLWMMIAVSKCCILLKKKHLETWNQLGQPEVSVRKGDMNPKILTFILTRKYKQLGDSELDSLVAYKILPLLLIFAVISILLVIFLNTISKDLS